MIKEQQLEYTALQRLREWLTTYPGYSVLQGVRVDYTDASPYSAGVYPKGQVELGRTSDILGNVTVQCEYNFELEFALPPPSDNDTAATNNAEWLMEFQRWVEQQSARGLAPIFGNDASQHEKLKAEKGKWEKADGTQNGTYKVLITAAFKNKYEVNEYGEN